MREKVILVMDPGLSVGQESKRRHPTVSEGKIDN